MVHPAVPVDSGKDTEKYAKEHGNHHGRQRQFQGGREIPGQLSGHRHLGADGDAHIPMEKAFHINGILGKNRFIEAQGLPGSLQGLRRRMGPHQHAGRVPGNHMGNAEGDNGHTDKDKDEMKDSLKYKTPGNHRPSLKNTPLKR